jgi:cytochrome P450
MTPFLPPKPHAHARTPSKLRRLLAGRRSSLALFSQRSYTMKMGELRGIGAKTFFLVQPDLVRKLLTSPPSLHPKSDILETLLVEMVGQGVFVSTGEVWERRRGMVDQAFSAANVSKVFPLMLDAARDLADRLANVPNGATVDVDVHTTHVAADIIFRTLFSEPLGEEEARTLFEAFDRFQNHTFAHGFWTMAGLPKRLSPAQWRAKRPARVLRAALAARVDQRLAHQAQGGQPHGDLLDALIDARDAAGIGFTRDELVDEAAVMFLAGHETSASALAWAFYLIAHHPAIDERLDREVAKAIPAGAELSPSHFRHLPLVRDVFRETLRLYPPIAFVPRSPIQDETWRDKTVRAGEAIFVSLWLLHRNGTVWTNPDGFDPDRYSTPDGKAAMRTAHLPFSTGPRVCIGAAFALQEAAVVMATILQRFQFTPEPGHTPRPVAKLTLRSENGVRLRLHHRPVHTAT